MEAILLQFFTSNRYWSHGFISKPRSKWTISLSGKDDWRNKCFMFVTKSCKGLNYSDSQEYHSWAFLHDVILVAEMWWKKSDKKMLHIFFDERTQYMILKKLSLSSTSCETLTIPEEVRHNPSLKIFAIKFVNKIDEVDHRDHILGIYMSYMTYMAGFIDLTCIEPNF